MAKKLGITEYYKVELKSSFIDESGFRYSPDKTRLFRAPGQLKTYILPEGVTIICDRAFMNRATYEEIDLPDSLKYIGDQAFAGCHRLKSIRIPAGVQVSENAFEGCSPLLKTEIPYIDKSSGLTTNEMPTVTDNGGEIIVNGETLVIAPKNCIDYQVPEGIVTIAAKAFYKNKKLQSVSLPKSVEVIEAQAFLGCENLSSIEFPPNIKTIGESAFSSCMSLSEISLPPRVAIRQHAFTNCRRMKFVEIGEDSTIFEGVFHECAWLKTVSIPLSVRFIKDKDIYSYRFPFLYCPSLSKESSKAIYEICKRNFTQNEILFFIEGMPWYEAILDRKNINKLESNKRKEEKRREWSRKRDLRIAEQRRLDPSYGEGCARVVLLLIASSSTLLYLGAKAITSIITVI